MIELLIPTNFLQNNYFPMMKALSSMSALLKTSYYCFFVEKPLLRTFQYVAVHTNVTLHNKSLTTHTKND